jgi:hypothetical protein
LPTRISRRVIPKLYASPAADTFPVVPYSAHHNTEFQTRSTSFRWWHAMSIWRRKEAVGN